MLISCSSYLSCKTRYFLVLRKTWIYINIQPQSIRLCLENVLRGNDDDVTNRDNIKDNIRESRIYLSLNNVASVPAYVFNSKILRARVSLSDKTVRDLTAVLWEIFSIGRSLFPGETIAIRLRARLPPRVGYKTRIVPLRCF